MHWVCGLFLGAVLTLAVLMTLFVIVGLPKTWLTNLDVTRKLYSSGVGPLVVHADVHDAVYDQWRMRISDEMYARERKFQRGAFGSNYPTWSSCCTT